MLLPFVVVFYLPLCLAFLFYFYSNRIMVKQLEISNTNLLQTIRSVCDQEIRFYQNIKKRSENTLVSERFYVLYKYWTSNCVTAFLQLDTNVLAEGSRIAALYC